MCAITGFFLRHPPPSEVKNGTWSVPRTLERMLKVLLHRGPDGQGKLFSGAPSPSARASQLLELGLSPSKRQLRAGGFLEQWDISQPRPARVLLTPPLPESWTLALGTNRLAIVDRAQGLQPTSSEDGQILAILNGELYNHQELRARLEPLGHQLDSHSDASILPHLYEQHSFPGMLAELRGMFALALWDQRRETLFLARDPVGEKPLFYALRPEGLYFASELKGLLSLPWMPRQPDYVALTQSLVYETIPPPRTPFQGICALEPGQFLSFGPEGVQLGAYHHWPTPGMLRHARHTALFHGSHSAQTLLDRVEAQLRSSVARQLMGEVPVGLLLSGGLDSGLVARYAAELRPQLPAFSLGFEEPSFDEREAARETARVLHLPHHVEVLREAQFPALLDDVLNFLDAPLADGSLLPTFALMKFVRQHGVLVALAGDGGDEAFAGYPTHQAGQRLGAFPALPRLSSFQPWLERLARSHENLSPGFKLKRTLEGLSVPPALRQAVWMSGWLPMELETQLTPEWMALLRGALEGHSLLEGLLEPSLRLWPVLQHHEGLERSQLHDLCRYLPDDLLVKTDRASMACGLEVRAPLLDPEGVRLGLSLPPELKVSGLESKVALRRLAAKKLPASVVSRPKKGFGMPTAHWLRRLPVGQVEEWLRGGETLPAPLTQAGMQALVQAHRAGKADHRKRLWPLIILSRWSQGRWGY
ncbi:MAG: asparagine synthase (glutamine-hydrolyzing) [Myxococcota bacterium]